MITVSFHKGKSGFTVSGHSDSADRGEDIICASVSSAAYMAANTLTEVIGVLCEAEVDDGYINFRITETSEKTDIVIDGFRLHIEQICSLYPENVIIRN